ncbi:helix-turn-helix domain-containing protein, partial [Staphylococcus saprophyticus]|uniref:helix-turn-helix domain-containing protein n=2 Tax=Bacillati TaxID=1783272 RepID=UPI003D07851D
MTHLFNAVDNLIASRSPLPPAQERKRLRVAHGLTLDEVAGALKVRRATVSGWESVKKTVEPRGPEREAYARLLRKLAELYPAPTATEESVVSASSATLTPAGQESGIQTPVSRRPGARKAAPAGCSAPRFENGPLAVVDVEGGQVLAYCAGGLVLEVPATSLPALVEWTLEEAKLGQPRLSGPGKDADPLLVLTEA